jgi:hypothetical protein
LIEWSQPEILLYDDDPFIRMSYPDLIEEDGRFYITETQKSVGRVHEIPASLLDSRTAAGQGLCAVTTGTAELSADTGLDRGAQAAVEVTAAGDERRIGPGPIPFNSTCSSPIGPSRPDQFRRGRVIAVTSLDLRVT